MAKSKYGESPKFKVGVRYAGESPAPWPAEDKAKLRKAVERLEKRPRVGTGTPDVIFKKKPSEASLERYAKKQVEARGGLYLKFVSPGFTGVPDRLCVKPDGSMFFVEHKAPGGRLSARQKIVISQLNEKNVIVYILDGKRVIDSMVKHEFE